MMEFLLLAGGIMLAVMGASELVPSLAPVAARVRQLQAPTREKASHPLHRIACRLDPLLRKLTLTRRIDRRLARVGLAWTPSEFLLASGLIALTCGFLGGIALRAPALSLALAALGGALPTLWLHEKCKRHNKALSEQLPDAIMLIIGSLRAGNSFLQTMQLIARQLPDPIAGEFNTTVREIDWGVPVETALANLQARVGSLDMELMVSAVLIQRECGGNLTEILGNILDALRNRIQLLGEIQTLTAEGRLSGWIMGGMPMALGGVFFVINPAYIGILFSDPRGQLLLAVAALMQVMGALSIRAIVQVRY